MKRDYFLIVCILWMFLLSACNHKVTSDQSINHQTVTKKVEMGEQDEQSNTTKPVKNVDDSVTKKNSFDESVIHTIYSGQEPVYFRYFENLDNGTGEYVKGTYVLKAFDRDGNVVWDVYWTDLDLTELALGWEPLLHDGVVYIGVYQSLYALEAADGELIWKAEGTGSSVKPAIGDGIVYMAGYYGPLLTATDIKTGEILWRVEALDNFGWANNINVSDGMVKVLCEEFKEENNVDAMLKYDTKGKYLGYDYYTGDYYAPDYWNTVTASSTLEAGSGKYEPVNIMDQNFDTAWVEGVNGYGLTEWIQMSNPNINEVEYISVANGYQKSEQTYVENGKLSKYRIDFSDGTYVIVDAYNPDQLYSQDHIQLGTPVETNFIKLTILDSVKGTHYEDLCITEWMTR